MVRRYFNVSEEKCDICGERIGMGWDEDETLWCLHCVDAWEKKNNAYWATGTPKTGDVVQDVELMQTWEEE